MSDTQPIPFRRLSAEDAAALDALLDARCRGLDRGPAPAGSAERTQRLHELLGLLDQYPVEDPADDLTQQTLARLRTFRQRERFSQQVQMLAAPRPTLGVSWRQIVASAAIFLIGMSLLLPVLDRNRSHSQQLVGAANLASASVGFGKYAQDHRDNLPRRRVAPGGVWWNVGQPIADDNQPVNSNTAHLYLLVRQGYVTPESLAHPANPFAPRPGRMTARHNDWFTPEAVSFSYQNQFRSEPFKLGNSPDLVILADRNPIFVVRVGRMVQDTTTPLDAPSRRYDTGGQNVLTGDGAVTFTRRPVVPRGPAAGDLIWSARGVARYTGTEQPADDDDTFLVP